MWPGAGAEGWKGELSRGHHWKFISPVRYM